MQDGGQSGPARVRGYGRVVQLRLAVTPQDYDQALRFYRDVLGMPEDVEAKTPVLQPGGDTVGTAHQGAR